MALSTRTLSGYCEYKMQVGILIMLVAKSASIVPVLQALHWLLVWEHVLFNVLILVHKAINCQGPVYVIEFV